MADLCYAASVLSQMHICVLNDCDRTNEWCSSWAFCDVGWYHTGDILDSKLPILTFLSNLMRKLGLLALCKCWRHELTRGFLTRSHVIIAVIVPVSLLVRVNNHRLRSRTILLDVDLWLGLVHSLVCFRHSVCHRGRCLCRASRRGEDAAVNELLCLVLLHSPTESLGQIVLRGIISLHHGIPPLLKHGCRVAVHHHRSSHSSAKRL